MSPSPTWDLENNDQGGLWDTGFNPDGSVYVQFDFADSSECTGTNTDTQTGSAKMYFTVETAFDITMTFTGKGGGGEEMSVTWHDDGNGAGGIFTDTEVVPGSDADLTCATDSTGQVVTRTIPTSAAPGFELEIQVTSTTGSYHQGGFLRVEFSGGC